MDPRVTSSGIPATSPIGLRASMPSTATEVPATTPLADCYTPATKGFSYKPIVVPQFDHCTINGPDVVPGKDANPQITPIYEKLSKGLTDYLGQPALPNWATFGQFASRNAGVNIFEVQDGKSVTNVLAHPLSFLRHPLKGIAQIFDGLTDLRKDDKLQPGSHLVTEAINMNLAAIKGKSPGAVLSHLLTLPQRMNGALGSAQDALVQGNEGIVQNIAPAINLFLQAESQGQDGLKALEADPAYKKGGKNDPQGFLYQGFSQYQQARKLGQEAQALPANSPQRQQLLAERKQCVAQGNLYLGIQEQMCILQPIFDNSHAQSIFSAVGGIMDIHDPNGTYKLLPKGGNWLDFKTRMGFVDAKPTDPSAIEIQDPTTGKVQYYKVPSPPIPGTIADYFLRGLDPRYGQPLLNGTPAPMYKQSPV